MADNKYTYHNWLIGKFDFDRSLLSNGFITPEDYKLMLDKSYSIVIDKGKEEFNRLKANCIKRIQEGEKKESFTKSGFLKIENDYYNLLLNKVPPEGNGYLKLGEAKFNKFTQYDVTLIRSAQKYHSWLTDGKINLVLCNPLKEVFNVNNWNEFTSAVLAVAWRCYRNYLNEISTNEPKSELNSNKSNLIDLKSAELQENKFWKGLPMPVVISHFQVFVNKTNKNGDKYLTNEQFVSFINKGFLGNTNEQKQKINCAAGEKGLVIKRFYELFELAVSKYSHPNKNKTFIDLFNKCFDNWESNTIDSFFKSNKTKEKW